MSKTKFKDLTISSSFEEIQHIEPYIEELRHQTGFSDNDFARIMLTLSEAATNAIVHGNKENPQKKVLISSFLKDHILSISVKDEGEGFDPAGVPNPLKEENLLNKGGRGVYLINQYADDVLYSEKGTKLTMKFELEKS